MAGVDASRFAGCLLYVEARLLRGAKFHRAGIGTVHRGTLTSLKGWGQLSYPLSWRFDIRMHRGSDYHCRTMDD